MSIQDLGAIGEIVGAIAVVVSLVYLATQIRQGNRQIQENTNALRAAAVHSSLTFTFNNRAATFSDAGTADIYFRGMNDFESLNELERDRFRLIITNVFDSFLNMYSQTKLTGFSPETWISQEYIVKRVMSAEGGKWYWENFRDAYPENFRSEIRRISG
jgi:hypothetical protein